VDVCAKEKKPLGFLPELLLIGFNIKYFTDCSEVKRGETHSQIILRVWFSPKKRNKKTDVTLCPFLGLKTHVATTAPPYDMSKRKIRLATAHVVKWPYSNPSELKFPRTSENLDLNDTFKIVHIYRIYRIAGVYIRKKNSGALVHQRTIPTERPPLVGEVNANFSG
jgi:hypothetical protein